MEKKEINKTKEVIELIVMILISFTIAILLKHNVFTFTQVNMTSMVPTLQPGDRLILNRTMRITKKIPQRGEIITFEAPSEKNSSSMVNNQNPRAIYNGEPKGFLAKMFYYYWESNKISYIKRAIAFAGEKVIINDGKVFINDKLLEEPYLAESVETISSNLNDFVVPDGYIFAMGDNRQGSRDCREFGCIPIEKIEGIAKNRVLPINKFGKIDKKK